MKQFDQELVSGSILRSVWKLSWPIVLLQLIQGINTILGHVFVGNFVESEGGAANLAVGASWQIFLVIVVFVSSFIQGMAVLIARYSGKEDKEMVGKVMYQTVLSALAFHLCVLTPIVYFLAPVLLGWISPDPAVQAFAIPYMRLLVLFSGIVFLNFMLINAFQASGDPRTPLVLGLLSTVITAGLTFVLITGVGPFPQMGVNGAAIGASFGALPSVLIALGLIGSGRTVFQLPKAEQLRPDPAIITEVLRIGLPTGVQSILLNIGGVLLLYFISRLQDHTEAQAAYVLCYTQIFSFITFVSFGLRGATATLIGQNIGAGDVERGQRAVYVSAALGLSWAIALGSIYGLLPEQLLGLFGQGEEQLVLEYARELLKFLAISGMFVATALAFTGGMQGAGDTISPMVIALLTQIGVLIGLCAIFFWTDNLTATRIWAAIMISHLSRMVLSVAAFRWGRWRRIKVGIEEAQA